MRDNYEYGLTESNISHFIRRGFVVVKDSLNVRFLNRWKTEGMRRISRVKSEPDNGIIELSPTKSVFLHEVAPRAWKAACQLLGGEDRIKVTEVMDDFNLNMRTIAPEKWAPPESYHTGWHIDGDYFRRFLDSPEQGLLCLILWSRVGQKEGGTFLACDSIAKAARLMASNPKGLLPTEFSEIYKDCTDFEELTGEAGDIILCHPYMIHAPSPKTNSNVRLLTNPPISLLEPMNFNRSDVTSYSPVERAVLNGLEVDRFEFHRDADRERFDAWRNSRVASEA